MLERIVAKVESNNDLQAIRFEPLFYLKIKAYEDRKVINAVKLLHNCSTETAKMILATSFGKYQIMGYNLYGYLKYNKHIIKYLTSEADQDLMFYKFLELKRLDAKKILSELKVLTEEKLRIKKDAKDIKEFANKFRRHLEQEQRNYTNLFTFINRYNGSYFLSDNFMSYLLRLSFVYEREEEKQKEEVKAWT